MPIRVESVTYGQEARAVLAGAIATAKGDDPLTAVTVVAPTGRVALATRRLLASVELPTAARPGLANVAFLTVNRFAEQLAANIAAVASRPSLTDAVLFAALRAALATNASPMFAEVGQHPATVRALAATYRDLRGVGPQARTALRRTSPRAEEVVRLLDAASERVVDRVDERAVLEAATLALSAPDAEAPVLPAAVLFYLPPEIDPPLARLIAALGERVHVEVLLGVTGDELADQLAVEMRERLGSGVASNPGREPAVVRATAVVSSPSADAEVLHAVREVMARATDGVPLHRMAIVHSGADQYARLVVDALRQGGIPFAGASVRPLRATVTGRTLLGALALPERDWRREEVVSWMSGAPVLDRGEPAPAAAWDEISAEAGVIGTLEGWSGHLGAFAKGCRSELAYLSERAEGEFPPWRTESLQRRALMAERLAAFVDALAQRFVVLPTTWSGWSAWARALLSASLGDERTRERTWPGEEFAAHDTVLDSLGALGTLDAVEPAPSLGTFRAALALELERRAPREPGAGRGVFVGHVRQIVGLDFDTVFVLGMIDGAFPGTVAEDPLLPDRERLAAGGEVAPRATRAAEARRDYLAAMASAPERVVSFARGDQRDGRELRPSRWWLESLESLFGDGRRLYSRDLEALDERPGYRVLASYEAAITAPGEPATVTDRDLSSLLSWSARRGGIEGHYLLAHDPVLAAGREALVARRGRSFTRFDGWIGAAGVSSPVNGRPQSATGLESYASCPRRYMLSHVLSVSARDRPEDFLRIDPAHRGQLIHQTLEEFFRSETDRPREERIAPDTAWDAAAAERLRATFAAIAATYEQEGLTGRPLLWRLDRADIVRELDAFLIEDSDRRRRLRAVPELVEFRFGSSPGEDVAMELDTTRRISFRGFADRIDVTEDGTVVVIDYKTGSRYGFGTLERDPVARGEKLQLPIYGLAARARFGEVPVRAEYWFVSSKERFATVGYELDEARLERFRDALGVLASGIEAGAFPARPGEAGRGGHAHCRFCDYRALCPADRGEAWLRVRSAPQLADYVALVEPDAEVP